MDNSPLRQRLGLDDTARMSDTPLQRRLSSGRPTTSAPTEMSPVMHREQRTDHSHEHVATGSVRSVVKEMLETAIFILLIFFIVRGIVQNFKIEGSSMEPSLHSGQYILVNKLVYFHFDVNAPMRLLPGNDELPEEVVYPFHIPERGDVIVFEYPNDPRKDYIKRVIGLPGETVEIRDGDVYVNSQMIDEPYLRGTTTSCSSGSACGQGPVVVPEDSIFVMGDNRANSSDSREWEALPLEHVIGQAWILYYPVRDWGVVPHTTYAIDQ